MSGIPKKVKFAWTHIGYFRKAIVVVCLALAKVIDLLPDTLKRRVYAVIPAWKWETWLVLGMPGAFCTS